MNSYGREIFFVITILFTGIAALQSGPLKTKKVNPPDIFFEPPSLVTDFYSGNQRHLDSLLREKDVSLVMYYAPWDATSLQAREEFEKVARFYHNEVFFAAINCWWPEGECRKKYNLDSYPVIVAYVHNMGNTHYDGPIVSTYIIHFLDSVLSPVVPLHHHNELLDMLTKYEGVLVGYFEFKNGSYPTGYKQFYFTALKALSKDPYRRICFAVITNKVAAENLKMKAKYQLYLWNTTKTYTEDIISPPELVNWAYDMVSVSEWISPRGTKSLLLSTALEKSPSLILFTPRNSLLEYTPYYNMLREIALDYSNCFKSSLTNSIKHRLVLKRHIMQEEFSRTVAKCHASEAPEQNPDMCRFRPDLCDFTCCQTTTLKLRVKEGCACRVCLHHVIGNVEEMKLFECENTLKLVLKEFDIRRLGSFEQCNDIEASYPVKFGRYNKLSFHCEEESIHSSRSAKKELSEKDMAELKDDLILTMIQNNEKRLCHRLRFALNHSELNFPSFPDPSDTTSWMSNFTGMSCLTNRTLNFIAMDSVLYHGFAENLGVDISKSYHQTSAVIVEAKEENQFVLNEQVTKKSLVEFIKNYTAGGLTRHLRMAVRPLSQCGKDEDANVCVDELSTATFFDTVLEEKDVVLLYYAPWCGPCLSISHIYLTVADYFSNVADIKFARINGEENDLPWEYTVEKYPSILFFPAKSKSDSAEFPTHLPITMTNLLHFVLVHSQPKVRWLVSMEMCSRECIAHNLIRSSRELRRLHRELKALVNDLHFVQQIVYKPKKAAKVGAKSAAKGPGVGYLKTVYLKSVVERIHKKRRQIAKARQLQVLLRRKRDIFLKEMSEESGGDQDEKQVKKGKRFDFRQRKAKDEL